MDLFAASERAMGMSDTVWLRHANPASGWSRFAILPLLALAVWSRVWIGWWAGLPIALVIVWTFVNPRAFAPPRNFGAWMSRGVLGERLWLERAQRSLPAHHLRAARVLTAIAALGVVPFVWGLYALDPFATLLGLALTMGGKAWFLDRMVWLHADITGSQPGTPLNDPTFPDPQGPTS